MRRLCKREPIVALLTLALLLAGFSSIDHAYAATITVTTFADDLDLNGDCSLREAIQAANTDTVVDACPAGSSTTMDTIQLGPGSYALSLVNTAGDEDLNQTGDLDITGDLIIGGLDLYATYIDARSLDRAFHIHLDSTVILKGMSVINGSSSAGAGIYNDHASLSVTRLGVTNNVSTGNGGGVFNSGGTISIYESTIGDNQAHGNGSGIENIAGSVQIMRSTINNNAADGNGGGIYNAAQLLVEHTWIHDNSANDSGAGIFNAGTANVVGSLINNNSAAHNGSNIYSGDNGVSSLTISNTTILRGLAGANGGGVFNDGALSLTNVTIAENRAASGGGIYSMQHSQQPVELMNTTIVSNTNTSASSGAGVFNAGIPLALKNTLVAFNGALGNCAGSGSINSAGYNLTSDSTCNLTATGDAINTDPLLGPLQDNGGLLFAYGGAAPTYALLPGSPAINGGTNVGCPAVDQRGWPRPHGGRCDTGAFEANDAPRALADNYATNEDMPLIIAAPGLFANDSEPDADLITATLLTTPAHGALALNQAGAFSYTPSANYYGQDSFSYQLSDGFLTSASTLVTLTIASVNDLPIAGADAVATSIDTPLSIPVAALLSNDTDIESDPLTISQVHTSSLRGGQVVLAGGSVVYTPPAHFSGVDSFIYTLSDGNGGTASGTVSATVGAQLLYLPMARR